MVRARRGIDNIDFSQGVSAAYELGNIGLRVFPKAREVKRDWIPARYDVSDAYSDEKRAALGVAEIARAEPMRLHQIWSYCSNEHLGPEGL